MNTLFTAFLLIWATAYAGLVIFTFLLATPEHWQKLVADNRIKAEYAEYITTIPKWVIGITFLAAITRLGGVVALVLQSPVAFALFSISLLFVAIIMYRGFFVAKVANVIRSSQVLLEIAFFIISIAAVFYSAYFV